MPPISVTALRQNLFKIIDQVLETGVAVEVERHGKKVILAPLTPVSKLAKLKRRDVIIGDPEALTNLQVGEWREPGNL